ncbi:MAG: dCTP deaminase [Gammaproteobacteria bacterium]|nr:dCTP deaminase [Gammaproteobacteria bacterium]
MMLSDVDILARIDDGSLVIDPMPSDSCIGSYSVDVHLSNHFRVFRGTMRPFVDIGDGKGANAMSGDLMEDVVIKHGESFHLHPGQLALGLISERLEVPDDLACSIDGRSSLGRLGLAVHVTAHAVDAGWRGQLTLEMINMGPLPLAVKPGIRIAQVSFQRLMTPTSRPYYAKEKAKYRNQTAPIQSRIDQDAA